nr:MAG TPA: hypothetical protein [Caudoviricetes sp.]
MSLGITGFLGLISPKREQERKPRHGFQVLSNLGEKRSTMILSPLMISLLTFRNIFFLSTPKIVQSIRDILEIQDCNQDTSTEVQ